MRYLRKYKEFRKFKKMNEAVGTGGSVGAVTKVSTQELSKMAGQDVLAKGAEVKATATEEVAKQVTTSFKSEMVSSQAKALTSTKVQASSGAVDMSTIGDYSGSIATIGILAAVMATGLISTSGTPEPVTTIDPYPYMRSIAFGGTSETECYGNAEGLIKAGFKYGQNKKGDDGKDIMVNGQPVPMRDRFWTTNIGKLKKAIEAGDVTQILASFEPASPEQVAQIDPQTRTVKSTAYPGVLIGDYLKVGNQGEMKHSENGKRIIFSMAAKNNNDVIVASGNGILALKRMMEGAIKNKEELNKLGKSTPDVGVITSDAKRNNEVLVYGFKPGAMRAALAEVSVLFQAKSLGGTEAFVENYLELSGNKQDWTKQKPEDGKTDRERDEISAKRYMMSYRNSIAGKAMSDKFTPVELRDMFKMSDDELVTKVQEQFIGMCGHFIPKEMYKGMTIQEYYPLIAQELDFKMPSKETILEGLSAWKKGYCDEKNGDVAAWKKFTKAFLTDFVHNFNKYTLTIIDQESANNMSGKLLDAVTNKATIAEKVLSLGKIYQPQTKELEGTKSSASAQQKKEDEEYGEGE